MISLRGYALHNAITKVASKHELATGTAGLGVGHDKVQDQVDILHRQDAGYVFYAVMQ